MKLWQKIKFQRNSSLIKKYKLLGITLLRKEKTPTKKRWNILGFKICKKYCRLPFIQPIHRSFFDKNQESVVYNNQRIEFSETQYKEKIAILKKKPKFSVIMPIYNADPKWLEVAVQSLQKQYYENWELYAVDDGSVDRRCCALLQKMATEDKRIIFHSCEKNGGISAASNVGLSLSENEYFLLMDQDDEITPDALYWFAQKLNDCPDADVIYSDECKINQKGYLFDFYFKPDWSPALLLNHMYTSHLSLYRQDVVQKVGGFRSEYDFSQDYDLILRVSDVTDKIYHIERVLYFWRTLQTSGAAGGKDFARTTNIAALQDWYKRQGLEYIFNFQKQTNYGKTRQTKNPLVSIIIPSDSLENLTNCIQKIVLSTSYTNYEIVPVTNSKTAKDLTDQFSYMKNMNICHYNKIFNFSDKCNDGAQQANGEYVVFYNDDVCPETPDWIERLLDVIYLKNVGAVSPLLRYEDGRIQYAGMMTNVPGIIGTSFHCYDYRAENYHVFQHHLVRNVSVLSGACLLMRKDLFIKIGMFDAINTPNGHSDVDISFKIMEQGLFNVCAPAAKLVHIGNHTWHVKNKADKADIFLLKRWGKYLSHEPYFTNSMKKVLYHDFPWEFHIHSPENLFLPKKKNCKDVLLISHQLSRTGGPKVILEMAKVLVKNNYFPVVLSPEDGPLKQEFLDLGVTVIIDSNCQVENFLFERFARNFDLVVVCTLACGWAIKQLNNSLAPVLWWIHEGSMGLSAFQSLIPQQIAQNIHIYCGGEYSKRIIQTTIKNKIDVLLYGVEDELQKNEVCKDSYINFITAASVERRKGQDILIEAIKKMPSEYQAKCKFTIIGKVLEANVGEMINTFAEKMDNVTFLKSVPLPELMKLYQNMDVLIAPSRDDPMPVVVTEGLMLKKICLCSSNCGTADYIEDGKNGFVFESENKDELAQKIMYIIDNFETLDSVRLAGRKIYEKYFTLDIFEKNILKIMEEICKKSS